MVLSKVLGTALPQSTSHSGRRGAPITLFAGLSYSTTNSARAIISTDTTPLTLILLSVCLRRMQFIYYLQITYLELQTLMSTFVTTFGANDIGQHLNNYKLQCNALRGPYVIPDHHLLHRHSCTRISFTRISNPQMPKIKLVFVYQNASTNKNVANPEK